MSYIPFAMVWILSVSTALFSAWMLRKHRPVSFISRTAGLSLSLAILAGISFVVIKTVKGHSIDPWILMNISFRTMFFYSPLVFIFVFCLMLAISTRQQENTSRRALLLEIVVLCVLTLAFALPLTGVYMRKAELNWVQTSVVTVHSPKIKSGTAGLKILQISDTHIEQLGRRERRALAIVREMKPDIIVLTGDYVNRWDKASLMKEFAKQLDAPFGIYAVSGNWNWNPDLQYSKFFRGTKVRLINGTTQTVNTPAGRIRIAGVDYQSGKDGTFKIAPSRDYTILLSHSPNASLYVKNEVDFIFAGHTHGGQIRIPGIGPIVTFSNIDRRKAAGLSRISGGGYMYVNRGLGMEGGKAPRIRLFCRPEIAIVDIKPVNWMQR